MNANDFGLNAPGRLVSQGGPSGEYLAYVPNPLPRSLELKMQTVQLLSRADLTLGELNGIGQMLPNPDLLISVFIRREVVSSSRIEGTITDYRQLVLFEADKTSSDDLPDRQEVANHISATNYGFERLATLPICLRLIREVHERLMLGVRGEDKTTGQFRRVQNMIGRDGQTAARARFVPLPVAELQETLDDLQRFMGHPTDMPTLVDLALIHYQFETIHPFLDGNGRMGRLLINLLLCERRALVQPLLYLSAYLEKHKKKYVDYLLHVSQTGDWEPWVAFFLEGVASQARAAVHRSRELLRLREDYRMRWSQRTNSNLILGIIDKLFEQPAVTTKSIKEQFGVTFRAAQMNIDKLMADGILVEVTGKERNRIYLAAELVQIVTRDDD